jgi:MFS superfamily sulfate permease-like transporter
MQCLLQRDVAVAAHAMSLLQMRKVSPLYFYSATIALGAVLLPGILQGILLAATVLMLMLIVRVSCPHVAFLGYIPGTNLYSDIDPENEALNGVVAFRPNADAVLDTVLDHVRHVDGSKIGLVVCDLSASPHIDLAGSRILRKLHASRTPVVSRCASSARTARCVICCEPMAWARK